MPPSPPPSSSSRRPTPASTNVVSDAWNRFHNGHEFVKNSVHSYWRRNNILSPKGALGKVVMSCVYFSMPVVVGYFVVTSVVDQSESTVRERLVGATSANNNSTSGVGSSAEDDQHRPPAEKIGAGGWGGGVRLADSNRAIQDTNRINLERFLKKQQRVKKKRERAAAAAAAAAHDE